MCGIAGVVRLDGGDVDPDVLQAMTDAIAHRGPDGQGRTIEGPVALGHRRLAIIDTTEAAAQPMESPDGAAVISYNGEVYNFRELREELEGLGARFTSRSDTEVVLAAYTAWGEGCVERFNGMFALAIWDRARQRLVLARDRYGIKPLHVHRTDRLVAFASEVKALLCHPDVPRRLDARALREYFTFQNLLSDRTFLEDIRMLPPATVATLDVATVDWAERTYWDPTDIRPTRDDEAPERRAARVRHAFERAVERQLVADVPVGSHLSGGMDSGSIVAVASRSIPRIRTFTGGFDMSEADGFEISFDERDVAERVAGHVGAEHFQRVMHSGDMQWVLPELAWHVEDPRLGMSWQNYYIDGLASRFVKVALSGAGGDELFGGYPWRYRHLEGPDGEDAYFAYWQRLVPPSDHAAFFTDAVLDASADHDPREIFDGVLAKGPGPDADAVERALDLEFRTFLHGLLVLTDKISMAHGLELRVPFLDNDLVDLALSLPAEAKVGPGVDPAAAFVTTSAGKRVLRQAMLGLIPAKVLERHKQGFSPPDGSWYRGPTRAYIEATLLDQESRLHAYVRPEAVRRVLEAHDIGGDQRLMVWSLLFFEWWLRAFDPDPPTNPKEATPWQPA